MRIWLEANKEAHDFIDGSYWESKYALVREMIPRAAVHVYEVNGRIQGFMGLMDGYIAGTFVSAGCRSGGVGRKLLDFARQTRGRLSLHVYKKNRRVIAFYLREGFMYVSEQLEKETGEVELVMMWAAE